MKTIVTFAAMFLAFTVFAQDAVTVGQDGQLQNLDRVDYERSVPTSKEVDPQLFKACSEQLSKQARQPRPHSTSRSTTLRSAITRGAVMGLYDKTISEEGKLTVAEIFDQYRYPYTYNETVCPEIVGRSLQQIDLQAVQETVASYAADVERNSMEMEEEIKSRLSKSDYAALSGDGNKNSFGSGEIPSPLAAFDGVHPDVQKFLMQNNCYMSGIQIRRVNDGRSTIK